MTTLLTRKRFLFLMTGYAVASIVILAISPIFGSERLSWDHVVGAIFSQTEHVEADIFFYHRIPRVLLAFLVGGTLAIAGSALQVVLRNPLAEPFILGITGGGALGAVIAISVPGLMVQAGPFSSVQVLSLLGCVLCMGAIYRLAKSAVGLSMNTILLAGVTINILCGAAILLVRYLVSPHLLVAMDRWMMGGLDVVGYRELSALLPLLIPGLILLFLQGNALNQLALGEEMAIGHGVNVASVQKQVFLGTGLATAAAVSLAGPIGFVGLIIPHAVRRLSGFDHRVVLPASFFLGGSFLTACDLGARTVVAPTEMPVGIITAMIGGPVFLRILLKKTRRHI
jgi:iron complex transport system permease protein